MKSVVCLLSVCREVGLRNTFSTRLEVGGRWIWHPRTQRQTGCVIGYSRLATTTSHDDDVVFFVLSASVLPELSRTEISKRSHPLSTQIMPSTVLKQAWSDPLGVPFNIQRSFFERWPSVLMQSCMLWTWYHSTEVTCPLPLNNAHLVARYVY